MSQPQKSHAKDYLIEHTSHKDTPRWLASLIQKVISNNGALDNSDKESIFQMLLTENKISNRKNPRQPNSQSSPSLAKSAKTSIANQKLTLQKITHIKGVNALIPHESIVFSPACTVIFGLNGSGKSGYFRIINELSGGLKRKDIIDNIYRSGSGLEVDIDYLINSSKQGQYKWIDKTKRGIPLFSKIKVFDSEYLPTFLDERKNSVNIEPLGLHFFQKIVEVIDYFKQKLSQLSQQAQDQIPDLNPLIEKIHSSDLRMLLSKKH